jgi:VWFA-related protein
MVNAAASQALSLGDQDIRVTLGFVKEIVGKMSTLPGQRLLILISPGFLSVTPEAMFLKSQIVDAAAQANVTISALDARGLYTTGTDVIEQGGHSTFGLLTGRSSQHQRDAQEFQGDVLAELADGTGGTFVHNTNDLEEGLRRLADAPEYLYLLELPLQGIKRDGTYHPLKVKLNQEGLKLQARRGYFAPKPDNSKN